MPKHGPKGDPHGLKVLRKALLKKRGKAKVTAAKAAAAAKE